MRLYKIGKNYHYSFSLRKKRHRGSCFTDKLILAKQYAEKQYIKAYNSRVLEIKTANWEELTDYFLKHNKHYMASISQSVRYQLQLVIKLGNKFFGKKDINSSLVQQFLNTVQGTRKLSNRTMVKYIDSLNTIFKFNISNNQLNINPLEKLDLKIFAKAKQQKRVRFLSQAEFENLLEQCTRQYPIILDYILFAKETGLRQGEQLNLTFAAIDFKAKTAYIPITKTDVPRVIPLSPICIKILLKAKKSGQKKPFPLARGTLNHKWSLLLKQTNIKNFRWHDLRHTFASWAVKGWHSWQKKPMDLYKVSKWLGHTDIKMTQRYAHLQIEDLKQEIN